MPSCPVASCSRLCESCYIVLMRWGFCPRHLPHPVSIHVPNNDFPFNQVKWVTMPRCILLHRSIVLTLALLASSIATIWQSRPLMPSFDQLRLPYCLAPPTSAFNMTTPLSQATVLVCLCSLTYFSTHSVATPPIVSTTLRCHLPKLVVRTQLLFCSLFSKASETRMPACRSLMASTSSLSFFTWGSFDLMRRESFLASSTIWACMFRFLIGRLITMFFINSPLYAKWAKECVSQKLANLNSLF